MAEMLSDVRAGLRVRASKGVHLVVPRSAIAGDPGTGRADPADATSVLFVIPWGGTGSSAPPTPTGGWTGPTRPPAAPTSTTCSSRSTGCSTGH